MGPSQNQQKAQNEEHDDDGHNKILIKEIDSWSNYEFDLREENRLLFNKMLSECKENEDLVRAANSKDENYAESLFMALILQQQKTINELIAKASEWKRKKFIEVNGMID
jgi:hypothetical protein